LRRDVLKRKRLLERPPGAENRSKRRSAKQNDGVPKKRHGVEAGP